jgi:4-amino-4-deoxy-L-arabinose transferase-like glycosyltransferase
MVTKQTTRWLAIAAILLFFYLALDSMVGDSPTMDEQNHIARGLAFLRTGDPRLSVEHPPLVNMLSALPLLTMPEIELPLDHPSWQRQPPDVFWYLFAEEFLWGVNRDLDIQKILFLSRLPVVYLTIGLALVGWLFARSLWGGLAPMLALVFLLFDPNILAHGRYVTTDVGGTLFITLATYLLWRLWRFETWNWRAWLAAVLGMGLAFGAKLSSLAFVPIWSLLALLPLYGRGEPFSWRVSGRRLLQLLSAGMAAILIVWLIYGFEWGNFLFLDQRLSLFNRFQGPMPTFWSGIERILFLSEGGRPAFLMGEFSSQGFPLYFPVAFALKTPLLTLALFFVAALLLPVIPATRQTAVFLLLPILIYFVMSMASALNIGYRHLLPILPFVALLIAGLASPEVVLWVKARTGRRPGIPYLPPALLFLLVLGLLLGDARIHPHYLSTFNSLAGGPANGHRFLVDSNIDWGQDLLRLRAWAAENEVQRLKLGWFGTADPDYYGLVYDPLPGSPRQPFYGRWTEPPFNTAAPEPGTYAISASALWELPLAEKNVYPWFRAREPDDHVGYSILIYEVP